MPTLSVEKFLGLTDLPLYNREPGWCKTLQNMRVRPGGYLEQRAGFDAIKPSGGTSADPITAGIFTGAHEHTMADGYIFTYETTGGTYSGNLAQRGQFELWSSTDDEQHDAIYIGSTVGQFSRAVFFIAQGVYGAAPPTFTYEYPQTAAWDTDGTAASTGDLALTSTPAWTTTGEQVMEWAIPSDWVKSVRNGIYGWWVRVRLATLNDGVTTAIRQGGTGTTVSGQKVYCDWPGAREIYVASADSSAATNNGILKYYGQSSASVSAWNSVSTSLFSGNYPRVRFASYRNLLYFVNGKEQKRWDGHTLADIGFPIPVDNGTAGVADSGGGAGLTGAFAYALTYGYGPAGEWGESAELTDSGFSASLTDNAMTVTLDVTPGAQVEAIYIYRTTDLTSVPSSAQGSFPMFRIATVYRNADGTWPATYSDSTAAFPFPPVELNVAARTPPPRCKHIGVHKNRLWLGGNNQYPGRVWWSEPFQAEAFNTDENFADFTRSTGGVMTGMVEFNDQMVVMTEDQMFGIANVDQDQPSIYVIHPGIGCIAPDSLRAGNGSLMWVARDGVYRWTGEGLPERVSNDIYALHRLTVETNGGARGVIHNQMYDVYFIKSDNTEAASPRYRYDMVTGTWSTVLIGATPKWGPLVSVTAPLAHADAGVRHPLYGATATGGTDYAIYLGEMTNQDGGSNFTCSAAVLIGPRQDKALTPRSIAAIYYVGSSSSFGSTTLEFGAASALGPAPATASTPILDGATDYSRLQANASNRTTGAGDVTATFSGITQSATVTIPARLLALHVEASIKDAGGQN